MLVASLEPVPVSGTAEPSLPVYGPPALTFGGTLTVNVAEATRLALPALSVAFARSVYEPSPGKAELGNAYDQFVVPVASRSTSVVLENDVPSQYFPSLARCRLTLTACRPLGPASLAVPQTSPVGVPQPPSQVAAV